MVDPADRVEEAGVRGQQRLGSPVARLAEVVRVVIPHEVRRVDLYGLVGSEARRVVNRAGDNCPTELAVHVGDPMLRVKDDAAGAGLRPHVDVREVGEDAGVGVERVLDHVVVPEIHRVDDVRDVVTVDAVGVGDGLTQRVGPRAGASITRNLSA